MTATYPRPILLPMPRQARLDALAQGETRTRAVRQARRLVCPVAVRYLGFSGAVAPVHLSTHPR